MINKRFKWVSVLLCALTVVACEKKTVETPCTDPIGCLSIDPSDPIHIGVLQDLSGENAKIGGMQVRMIQLAVDRRNGKLLGHPIVLQIENSECSPEGGTAAANRVALNLNTVAAIGTHCSASAATASSVLSKAGLTMISGSNSAPSLTSVEGKPGANQQPGYFRVMFNGAVMARAAAFFVHQALGKKQVSLVVDESLYAIDFAAEFKKTTQQLGGRIATTVSINKGDRDMLPIIEALLQSKPESIFFPIYQKEALTLIRQLRAVKGTEHIALIGSGALLTASFVQSCQEDCMGIYFASGITPKGPASERLQKTYKEKYGENPEHYTYAYTYDAANLLFSAIESVAVTMPDDSLHISRKALRDAMHNTRNFKGITGTLNCDEFGDCSANQFNIVRFETPREDLEGLKSNIVYTYAPDQEAAE